MTDRWLIEKAEERINLSSEGDVFVCQTSVRVGRSLELAEKSVNECHRSVSQKDLPNEKTAGLSLRPILDTRRL